MVTLKDGTIISIVGSELGTKYSVCYLKGLVRFQNNSVNHKVGIME